MLTLTAEPKLESLPLFSRRARRRWLERLRRLRMPWLWGLMTALSACKAEPASIRVKGPRDAVESVKMDPKFAPFTKKGETIKLRASSFDKEGVYMGPAQVRWDSSDRTVATVDHQGVVTILSSGEVDVIAKTEGLKSELEGKLSLAAEIVSDVRLANPKEDSIELALGEIRQLEAQAIDDRGRPMKDAKLYWESSSFAATVTPTGELEGRAIGTTQISVEDREGHSDRLDVNVVDWKKGGRK